jgi:hypothetical protein
MIQRYHVMHPDLTAKLDESDSYRRTVGVAIYTVSRDYQPKSLGVAVSNVPTDSMSSTDAIFEVFGLEDPFNPVPLVTFRLPDVEHGVHAEHLLYIYLSNATLNGENHDLNKTVEEIEIERGVCPDCSQNFWAWFPNLKEIIFNVPLRPERDDGSKILAEIIRNWNPYGAPSQTTLGAFAPLYPEELRTLPQLTQYNLGKNRTLGKSDLEMELGRE